jgi:steroid 5-alpha reductase family enzyme
MSGLAIILIGLVAVMLVMAGTWLFSIKIDNFSIVDSVWAFCFIIQAAIFAVLTEGFWQRKLLLFAVVCVWGLRLGLFLAIRILGHHPQEDRRYVQLRAEYGSNYKARFLIFFQLQAFSVSLLTIPFILILQNTQESLSIVEVVGAAVSLLSIFFEGLSDAQMSNFKSNKANAGKVCTAGLWKYSRHPNYFFEICVWWGYFIFALGSPNGVYSIYLPLVMTFLITKVTGIPLAEKSINSSKYDNYRKTTSVLIPWFPKK